MYKLIAIDIDGTLLNSKKEVTAEVREALQLAREEGVKIVISTGRPLPGVLPLLADLELTNSDEYVICFNGALVQENSTGEVVSKIELELNDFKDIYSLVKAHNLHAHINTPTNLITPNEDVSKYTIHEATLNGIEYVVKTEEEILAMTDLSICKMMVIDEPELLSAFIEQIPTDIKEKYTIVRSTPYFLEVLHKDANKGTGVDALCKKLGITSEEVIAIGDQENDQHMIEYAGLGVAMGNAIDSIKEISQYITKTNDEHGVAHVIHKYVTTKELVEV